MRKVGSHPILQSKAFGPSVRDEAMATIGAALYMAVSPDAFDGASDAEFELMEKYGLGFFSVLERFSGPGGLKLPEGFAKHFVNEVVPDLRIIRSDPEKRTAFRAAIDEVLRTPSMLNNLYTHRGTTYSDIASVVAGTMREGTFYNETRPLPEALVEILKPQPETRPVPVEGKEESSGDNK